jgi:hypothetical protein
MLCRETLDGSLEFPGIIVTRFAKGKKTQNRSITISVPLPLIYHRAMTLTREECVRARRSRPSSAYLLFAGRAVAGSPALREEGFAPAGSIFAAGVLAFAAAVPEVAFSPLGAPPAASTD